MLAICDERAGCVAVYVGEERNCLSGITRDPACLYYEGGEWDVEAGHWRMAPAAIMRARTVALAFNCGLLPSALVGGAEARK